MVIEFADEPKKPASDLVNEARELLSKAPEPPWFVGPDDAHDCPDHKDSGLALVDTGRSGDWPIARLCEWHAARWIQRSPDLLSQLCDELDQQVSRIATQAESLSTCHARMKLQKEAIEAAIAAFEWANRELGKQSIHLAGGAYAPVLQRSRQAVKALRDSIIPEGEQK